MSPKRLMIYEIARNLKEASELRDAGFGYETKASAIKALKSPEIDDYYRNLLHVFALRDEAAEARIRELEGGKTS